MYDSHHRNLGECSTSVEMERSNWFIASFEAYFWNIRESRRIFKGMEILILEIPHKESGEELFMYQFAGPI